MPHRGGGGQRPQQGESRAVLHHSPFLPPASRQRDSARNLEWLKTVKESHGSVELSSLSLATAINNKGVYVIEAPADGQKVSPPTARAQSGGSVSRKVTSKGAPSTDFPRHGSAFNPSREPRGPGRGARLFFRRAEGTFEQTDANVRQEGPQQHGSGSVLRGESCVCVGAEGSLLSCLRK